MKIFKFFWHLLETVLFHEHGQWIIIGLIHWNWKSQKKAVKSNFVKILRKCNFNFFNAKNLPILASFEPSFPSSSIFLTFGIELIFPEDSRILVHDFRNFLLEFGLSWAELRPFLTQNENNLSIFDANQWFCQKFSLNGHNSAQKSPNLSTECLFLAHYFWPKNGQKWVF